MNRDRMTGFLSKRSPRAEQLVLIHDQGLATAPVVYSWETPELDAMRDSGQDLTDLVWDAAQGYADDTGEVCRFKIAWQTAAGAIQNSCVHSATPAGKTLKPGTADGQLMQMNRELLIAIGAKDRMIQGSIGIVLKAYEGALQMQERTIAAQQKTIEVLAAHSANGGAPAEDPKVTELKIKGLERALAIFPDVVRLGAAAYAEYRNERALAAATAAVEATREKSNGTTAPSSGEGSEGSPPIQ